MPRRLAVLDCYQTVPLAEIAKGRLEEEGVGVFLADDTEPAQLGPVAMPGWTRIRLFVRQEDLERARRILGVPAVP